MANVTIKLLIVYNGNNMTAKYIVYDYAIYIFPPHVNHADFARRNRFKHEEINGAGFIVCDDSISCFGESVSLKVTSRNKEDTLIAKRMLRGY